MHAQTLSAIAPILSGEILEIQADIRSGMPIIKIIGIPHNSLNQSVERIRTAIKNSKYKFPSKRITINISPSQKSQQIKHLDLAIAVAILQASHQVKQDFSSTMFIGELSLNAEVKHVKGVVALVKLAKQQNIKQVFVPRANYHEATLVKGIKILPIQQLSEICAPLPPPASSVPVYHQNSPETKLYNLDREIRVLSIAAAGRHHLLMSGSPGSGKTSVARLISTLLPKPSHETLIDINSAYSIIGKLTPKTPIIKTLPVREIHSHITKKQLLGSVSPPVLGEVTLANHGVILVDELPDFSSDKINYLKQILEDKKITLNHQGSKLNLPANFTMVSTLNPCKCGFSESKVSSCRCSSKQLKSYQSKIPGAFYDRIDLFLKIDKSDMNIYQSQVKPVELSSIQKQIQEAHDIQNQRYKHLGLNYNGELTADLIQKFCPLKEPQVLLLRKAKSTLQLTNRGFLKLIKIARTIADLDHKEDIENHHISEAVQYRHKDF